MKCRDSSRVVLRYPSGTEDTFIHANHVSGGPLFNRFIVTQAPMENTIGNRVQNTNEQSKFLAAADLIRYERFLCVIL